jgi:hypothetical protein
MVLDAGQMKDTFAILVCLLLAFTCQALVSAQQAVAGRIITVDDDGPADFASIQAAITDANHGDTVIVYEGTYTGDGNYDIDFQGKAITVRSEKGPDLTIVDCDGRGYGFRIRDNEVAEAHLEGFTIHSAAYGAIKCYSSSPPRMVHNMQIENAQRDYPYAPGYKDVVIHNCVAIDNPGGGILLDGHDNVTISNCYMARNGTAGVWSYMSWPTFCNCAVVQNKGTGIRATGATVINCTIADNSGYGIWMYEPTITNSIVWANTLGPIYNPDGGTADVTYSDVQDGWPGNGNIHADPCFVAARANYRLQPNSPCINAGDPNYVPEPNETDLDANPRITGARVDMGAYEFQFRPRIIYVDDDTAGANNGSSWQDAFKYLQDALADANSAEKPIEIRVAQGMYKPDQGTGTTPGDWEATFQLKNGVSMKGGYAGFGEPDPNAREIELHKTILSGDLKGDDGPDFANNSDNCHTVVTATHTDETAVLDGFIISGGHGWSGAGISCYESSPRIISCTITGNKAAGREGGFGGGMYNAGGSPTLINCTFVSNWAMAEGGGIYNLHSKATLTDCVFTDNFAEYRGGGTYGFDSDLMLTNCTFSENSADLSGGGMCNERGSATLSGCAFSGNSADSGGGLYNDDNSSTLIRCTFTGNSAEQHGGGMFNEYGSPKLTNCMFSSNSAQQRSGGAIFNRGYMTSQPIIVNCTFAANSAPQGSALACGGREGGSNPQLANCILWDGGDEIYNEDHSVIIVSYNNVQGGWPGHGNTNTDPLFANPDNGDYHLKSQAGRWEPSDNFRFQITDSKLPNGMWVQDDVTSPCVDAGDPSSPIGHEPFPNGGRINMGAYGSSIEASKSYFGEPVCETVIAGDINGDCRVDMADFAIMAAHWLTNDN